MSVEISPANTLGFPRKYISVLGSLLSKLEPCELTCRPSHPTGEAKSAYPQPELVTYRLQGQDDRS